MDLIPPSTPPKWRALPIAELYPQNQIPIFPSASGTSFVVAATIDELAIECKSIMNLY